MESAQEHEPTAYETLCNKLRALAKSEGRIMSRGGNTQKRTESDGVCGVYAKAKNL
jgi:hypothetical protein